jgi:hypothetical protein
MDWASSATVRGAGNDFVEPSGRRMLGIGAALIACRDGLLPTGEAW